MIINCLSVKVNVHFSLVTLSERHGLRLGVKQQSVILLQKPRGTS